MITSPHSFDQSYFESLGYLIHNKSLFIMVLITHCNNYFFLLKILRFLRVLFVFLFPYSFYIFWAMSSTPMTSTTTYKTNHFQICSCSPHLSPYLQTHTSNGLLDIPIWLFKDALCLNVKNFLLVSLTFSTNSLFLFYFSKCIQLLKPETEQSFHIPSLFLSMHSILSDLLRQFPILYFPLPYCYCIAWKLFF